ncbi:hypothetical protein GQ54DRAFT_313583 [Martensiomyces pterosporus]|nr:hypothetical protein GQ54DRAFT_313583 [Martensiomyces pterosporus]
MALAYLASRAVGPRNCCAITIDHGFRAESAFEAQSVGRYMRQLGVHHEIRRLEWQQPQGSNWHRGEGVPMPPAQRLEEVARERRYAKIAGCCDEQGISAVLTGHHAGDQAETFLFRFLRHSGVYGMAGMPTQTCLPHGTQSIGNTGGQSGPLLVRPLLTLKKTTLYDICKSKSIPWHEDASNKDARFKRNHLRQIISESAGNPASSFNVDSLLSMCASMQSHREFINRHVASLLAQYATFDMATGTVELSAAAAIGGKQQDSGLPGWAQNAALRERVLASIVGWVNGKDHPPELAHLRQFEQAIMKLHRQADNRVVGTPSTTSAAGVSMAQPSSKRGWLFCRQPPRSGEIKPIESIPLGATIVWDKRLAICVTPKGSSKTLHAAAMAQVTGWSVHSLDDAIGLWHGRIGEHRNLLKKTRKRLERHAVRVTQPVISIHSDMGGNSGGAAVPVFALGHTVEGTVGADGLDISVAMLKSPEAIASVEVF